MLFDAVQFMIGVDGVNLESMSMCRCDAFVKPQITLLALIAEGV